MSDSLWQFSRRWANTLRLGRRLGNLAWAKRLFHSGNTGGNFRVDSDGRLLLSDLDISISPGPQQVLLDAYSHALAAHRAGVRFSVDATGALIAQAGEAACAVETIDDVIILKEIYAEGTYGISGSGELLIFDIGMNVGHASLYFANRFPQAIVIGFEPFKPTFNRAAANFARNAALAERIIPNNFGLAAKDGAMDVEFDPVVPGRMGLFGIPTDVEPTSDRRREHVVLRNIIEVFDEALATHPNRPVLMKVDCEGAEYEILSQLCNSPGRLKKVDVLAIEWHRKAADQNPDRLTTMLTDSGFTVLCQGSSSSEAGMIYAVNARAEVPCKALVGT
jgi:FkbM family methyltransferase